MACEARDEIQIGNLFEFVKQENWNSEMKCDIYMWDMKEL